MNGIECGFGQVSCSKIDKAVAGIISQIVNGENFGDLMSRLVDDQLSTEETEQEMDTAIKAQASLVKVDEMTEGLNEASKNLNKLVDENAEIMTDAVKSISEIDFEGLNQAITDLQGAVGPLANFFGRFN